MEPNAGSLRKLSQAILGNVPSSLTALLAFVVFIIVLSRPGTAGGITPPSIRDPIPFVFNTIQFIFRNERFLQRVRKALDDAPIVTFRLAGKTVYVMGELKHYQALTSSRELTFQGMMIEVGFPKLWRMPADEVQRFARDKSGYTERPLPGTENTPTDQRYWAQKHHVFYDFLSRPNQIKPIVDEFGRQFSQEVEKYTIGEWSTMSIDKLTHQDFTKCAITTLFGPKILELNPDFLDAFWGYDAYVGVLVYGLPEWMYPAPYKASDRFLDRIEKYLDAGLKNFDWDGPDADAQWEPHFGTRVTRELAKWLTDAGFRPRTVAGGLGTLLFAQNSNTIPIVSWMLMELNKDPGLLRAVREEVATAFVTDPATGVRTLDPQKAVKLPLLQSVFTEVLRMCVSMVIMRTIENPMTIGGVNIPPGSLIHAYSHLSQMEEDVWGTEGHPVDQFWAERHISYVEEVDETGQLRKKRVFALAANSGYFFPFGCGVPICPGRHFAKNEVFTMVGILVDRFDMEFVKWTKMDGSPSDRPAVPDKRFSSIGTMPPDRDMIIRWKRIW